MSPQELTVQDTPKPPGCLEIILNLTKAQGQRLLIGAGPAACAQEMITTDDALSAVVRFELWCGARIAVWNSAPNARIRKLRPTGCIDPIAAVAPRKFV